MGVLYFRNELFVYILLHKMRTESQARKECMGL